MASLVGFSYPPGVDEEDTGIMVKRSGMDAFASTLSNIPLNSQHPDLEMGDSADAYRVGEVTGSSVDPETGAIITRASLDNTLDGWRTFREISEGAKRQLSTQKAMWMDDKTCKVSDHVALEVSCVDQGDNEHGAGFATSITRAEYPDRPDFHRHHNDILRLMNTSSTKDGFFNIAAESDLSDTKDTFFDTAVQPETLDTMTDLSDKPTEQPASTVTPPAETPAPTAGAGASSQSAQDLKNRQVIQERIAKEVKGRITEDTKVTLAQLEELTKKYEASEKDRLDLQNAMRTLTKRASEETAAAMESTKKDIAPWLATLIEAAGEKERAGIKAFTDKVYTPDKESGMFSDMQQSGNMLLAAAAARHSNAMSQVDAAVKEAASYAQTHATETRREDVARSLTPQRHHPYERPGKQSANAPRSDPTQPLGAGLAVETMFPNVSIQETFFSSS